MYSRRRNVTRVLKDTRGESQRVRDEHRPSRLIHRRDQLIVSVEEGCDLAQEQGQSLAAVPQIRMLRQFIELRLRVDLAEAKPGVFADGAKWFGGENGDVVTASA